MPYAAVADLPPEVRDKLNEDEQQEWLTVFNEVYAETDGDEEAAFAAAWGAAEKARTRVHVKAIKGAGDATDGTYVVGWGLLFTDEDDPDLDEEFFTDATTLLLEYYDSGPLWYEHRQDPTYGDAPVGKRIDLVVYPRGLWVEHRLDDDHPQFSHTVEEVEAGELAYSSDTALQLMERARRGEAVEITDWPIIGWSLVHHPAEPALGPVSLKALQRAVKAARHTGETNMKDNLLTQLAEFLGVEADTEIVTAKITEMKEVIEAGAGKGEADKMTVDLAALATALGLPEDAGQEQLLAALEALLQAMHAEMEGAVDTAGMSTDGGTGSEGKQEDDEDETGDEEDEDAKTSGKQVTFNYAKLASAAKRARDLSRQPVRDSIPGFHGKASRRSFQTGVTRKPGLADLLVAHVKGDARALKAAKAVGSPSGPAGGYMLQHTTSEEIIQPLYAEEVVMAAGARVERFPGSESITYRKLNAGATAKWGGPGQTVDQSQPDWGVVNIHPKELIAEVLIHNKALRNATDALEQQLRNDATKAIRLAMDYAFLFGVGGVPEGSGHSGEQPLGILNIAGITSTSLGTNGATPKFKDLSDAIGRVEDANVEMGEATGWIMAPRTRRSFTNKTDTTGNPLLRDGWAGGEKPSLLDYPYYCTTQVPIDVTVGSNSDNSYIFLGVWDEFVVGISMDVEIVIDESVYRRQRQTLMQVVTYVDCGVFYTEAFEVVTGVRP